MASVVFGNVHADGACPALSIQSGRVSPNGDIVNAPVLIDCEDGYLVPGFIDVQCNGGLGVDLSDASLKVEDAVRLLETLPSHGVTSVVATLISNTPSTYAHVVPILRSLYIAQASLDVNGAPTGSPPRARLLGLHLEGPYLHPSKRGAHATANLAVPDEASIDVSPAQLEGLPSAVAPLLARYSLSPSDLRSGLVRIVTLAPELPGADELTAALTSLGVVVSIGHTTATFEQAVGAVRSGASLVTHLFNAMPPLHHRTPGVVGLLGLPCSGAEAEAAQVYTPAESGPVPPPVPFTVPAPGSSAASSSGGALPPCPYVSLIADGGVHLHSAVLALTHRAQGSRVVLVTDAMRAMGMPPGRYAYGDIDVTIYPGKAAAAAAGAMAGASDAAASGAGAAPSAPPGGFYDGVHAVVTGTDTLAGAVLPLDACVRYFATAAGISIRDAVATVAAHPAKLLRLDQHLGHLGAGALGDAVLLDRDTLCVKRVWIGGVEVPLRMQASASIA